MRCTFITIALALLGVVYCAEQGGQATNRQAPEASGETAAEQQPASPAAGQPTAAKGEGTQQGGQPAQPKKQTATATSQQGQRQGQTRQAAPQQKKRVSSCEGSCATFRPPKTPIPQVHQKKGEDKPLVLDHYVPGPAPYIFEFDECTHCCMAARAPSSPVTKKYHYADPMFIFTSVKSDGILLWDGKGDLCFAQVPVVRVKFGDGNDKQCNSFGFFREYKWNELNVPRTRWLFSDGQSGDLLDRTDYVQRFGARVSQSELNVEDFNRDFFTCVAGDGEDVRVSANANSFLSKVTGGETVFYKFGTKPGETCEMADIFKIKDSLYCLLKLVGEDSLWKEALFFKSKQGWKRVKPGAAIGDAEFNLLTKEGEGCTVSPRDLFKGKSIEAVPKPGKRLKMLKNGDKLLFYARDGLEQILRVFLYFHANLYLAEVQIVDHEGNAYNLYYLNYNYGDGEYFQITISDFQAFRKVYAPNIIKRRTQTASQNASNSQQRSSEQASDKKMQASTNQAQQQAQSSQQSATRVG